MPLHLLGKKSWNVYRPENIARVKRDEAQAKAREEEDERRMQEVDAERRIKILRGERPPTPPPPPPAQSSNDASARPERKNTDYYGRYRKRRRLSGEDDTDRDIRMAREDAEQAVSKREELTRSSRPDSEAPLVDSKGHINLFPESKGKTSKNAEAEAEAKKMERSYEDQYTMRFSNAEGFKEHTGRQPWYSSGAQALAAPNAMPDKNVWGNEDPRRQDREQARMLAKDPLAAMKRGVRQLKATQEERKRLNEEKQKELEALKYEERHGSQHHRYHRQKRSRSRDSLDGFSLDASTSKADSQNPHESSQRRHRHYHRDRSRDRSRECNRDHSHRRCRHSSDRSHRHSHHDGDRSSRNSHRSVSGRNSERR